MINLSQTEEKCDFLQKISRILRNFEPQESILL